jgi:hypothetical protein
MSYAEAKQIALLRLELRLTQVAGNDNELGAEVKRWAFKLQVA